MVGYLRLHPDVVLTPKMISDAMYSGSLIEVWIVVGSASHRVFIKLRTFKRYLQTKFDFTGMIILGEGKDTIRSPVAFSNWKDSETIYLRVHVSTAARPVWRPYLVDR